MEFLDILDEEGQMLGRMSREEAEEKNHVIQSALLFVFTPDDKVWIQKRPLTKKHFPGAWDISACGAVQSGETGQQAIAREQQEEMGFTSPAQLVEEFIQIFTDTQGVEYRRYCHLFISQSEEVPQPNEEVDEFVAVPYVELMRRIEAAPEEYVPPFLVELEKAVEAFEKLKKKE